MTDAEESKPDSPGIERVLQSKPEVRAYYDKIARFYDLLAEKSEDPPRRRGLELLAPAEGEHILEIGFGTGHSLVRIAETVGSRGRVTGVDLSGEMLRIARERLRDSGFEDRVRLFEQDAAHLPLGDASLDGVFLSFTLELFDTPEIPVVLGECKRVLRPRGRLVAVSISKQQPRDPMVRAFEWTHRHFPNLLDCRPIYARRAIEEAGFDIAASEIQHMWLPVEIVLAVKP